MIKTCNFCNKIFNAINSKIKYCSHSCHAKNRTGNKNPNWKQGFIIVDGYKYILNRNHPNTTKMGYVLEHRMIMENKLGRYLTKKEIVHHVNHNKLDNREENLIIYESTGKHFIKEHITHRDKHGRFL